MFQDPPVGVSIYSPLAVKGCDWALRIRNQGILLFEMLTGRAPFAASSPGRRKPRDPVDGWADKSEQESHGLKPVQHRACIFLFERACSVSLDRRNCCKSKRARARTWIYI